MSDPTIMPFGKHKGVAVGALPDDYLRWLTTLDDLRDPVASVVRREALRRWPDEKPPTTSASTPPKRSAVAMTTCSGCGREFKSVHARRCHQRYCKSRKDRVDWTPCPTVDRLIAFWEANPPHACDPA